MDIDRLREEIQSTNEDDLLTILDIVSEEVKRRNSIKSPSIADMRSRPVAENVQNLVSALGLLGLKIPVPDQGSGGTPAAR